MVSTAAVLRSAKLVAVVEDLNPQVCQRLLGQGFHACLARPYSPEQLLHAVEKATDLIT